MNKLFGFKLAFATTNRLKSTAARYYSETYDDIIQKITHGKLIHADETKVSVKGETWFVWVLTSMEEVVYLCKESREGAFLQALLEEFKGVLVSDFYAAYDGIGCPQQKCLIHMMRDINDALYKNPYDYELKRIAENFKNLLKPIIETVDRFGLKKHFLKKHLFDVNRFFNRLSSMDMKSEPSMKCKQRLEKNRQELFTFLNYDGIPWNNNNAEHAIKAFAVLRNTINGVTSAKGLHDYLILLSICETCKYKGFDVLDFLRSGEKDIFAYAGPQERRRTRGSIERKQEAVDSP